MTQFTLFPSYVKIAYHGTFGNHIQTIPTLQWNPPSEGNPQGTFDTWLAGTINADDMINALVEQFAANFYDETTIFDNYTIYDYNGAEVGPPVPVAGNVLGIAGSGDVSGQQAAVQTTMIWRTTTFHLFKIVLLDSDSAGSFTDTNVLGTGTAQQLVDAEVTNESNGWASRDNSRPLTFTKLSKTLNSKLEKRPGS